MFLSFFRCKTNTLFFVIYISHTSIYICLYSVFILVLINHLVNKVISSATLPQVRSSVAFYPLLITNFHALVSASSLLVLIDLDVTFAFAALQYFFQVIKINIFFVYSCKHIISISTQTIFFTFLHVFDIVFQTFFSYQLSIIQLAKQHFLIPRIILYFNLCHLILKYLKHLFL